MSYRNRRVLRVLCGIEFIVGTILATPATAAAIPISEFPIPQGISQPYGITTGPDGNLWFTEFSGGRIGRITTAGAITEFLLPVDLQGHQQAPVRIAAGPDGNLWFTVSVYGGSKIGRITTAGVITEFPLPTTPGGLAVDIAAGSDGNLWFTESGLGFVGRISTAGAITEFPVQGAWGIAAGPDNNLWFANGTKIGRITTAGVITEFALPTVNSGATFVTAGPDGNLWFTEQFANKIGRITLAGVITEFTIPTANSLPFGIANGPDGDLWFAEQSGTIGRITTAGAITELSIPTLNSQPRGITAGPDGNVWFTEFLAGKVGKVNISQPLQITSVIPNSGPTAGGTSVTISATNFTSVSAVTFGASAATSYSVNNSTQIVATSPPGSGIVDVTVTTPAGTSAISAADKFAYTLPPVAYTAQSPNRILDTRTSGQTLSGGGSLNLMVAGGTTGVPATASGVVLNVTVTNTTAPSFLKVGPAGAVAATVSNLNWVAGETRANLVNVPVGTGGQVTINNGVGSVDVVVDEEGYFAAPSGTAGGYTALSPERLLDTRSGLGGCSTMSTGSVCDLTVLGGGGVPATGVSAVVLNATETNTPTQGYFTLYPSLTTRPTASNVNWAAGWTVPNRVIVKVGANGKVSIFNGQGAADAVVDVSGYFTDATASGKFFTPLTPARVLDTRVSGGTLGPAGTLSNFQITGNNGVPAGATAVFLNTTVTNTTASSALTVFPDPTNPTASDLNWAAGQTIPNLSLARLSSTGTTSFYNFVGSTDLVVDLSGYFS